MKQLSVFALLALLLYHLLGAYPVALWRQHELRQTAEARRRAALPDQALVRIAVAQQPNAAPDLVWHEALEFSYRGQLFDVVRQHDSRDSTIYFCWPDREEAHLLASLAEHVRAFVQPDAGTRKSAQKVLDYLAKLYLLPAADALSPALAYPGAKQPYAVLVVGWSSRPTTNPFAPPQPAIVA